VNGKITGADYPLAKIFSSDFDYEIPSYQRPYAWTIVALHLTKRQAPEPFQLLASCK
jgi:hypothetical protein